VDKYLTEFNYRYNTSKLPPIWYTGFVGRYLRNSFQSERGQLMGTLDQSNIVGIFRDRSRADHAIDELKQAGFREDQVKLTLYSPQAAEEFHSHADSRIIVTVQARGREQDAIGILFTNGANNADLPAGTVLQDDSIISSQAETTDLIPEPTGDGGFTEHSFFAEVHEPGHPDEIEILDNLNYPHG